MRCTDPNCAFENEPGAPHCMRCGRAWDAPPKRPAEVERERSLVKYYVWIWVPMLLWIIIVFWAC